jgi:hypothetical protein
MAAERLERKMIDELSLARASLRLCQANLAQHRRFLGEARLKKGRYTTVYETHVIHALDRVWKAQCDEVFEDHGDGFFETRTCARFVNNVDWEASRVASNNLAGLVKGVIFQKEPNI